MPVILGIHIAAGVLGLILATVALSVTKGGPTHRASGRLFVYAMLVMAASGVGLAILDGPDANALGGLTAVYLVLTALSTVRPRTVRWNRVDMAAMGYGMVVGLTSLTLGIISLGRSGYHFDGVPTPILFTFAAVVILGSIGDLRMLRQGGLRGATRLARHLWRMCFALWIATASFFLGQADEFPEKLRILPLLAILAFAPLVVLLFWLWRVRRQQP